MLSGLNRAIEWPDRRAALLAAMLIPLVLAGALPRSSATPRLDLQALPSRDAEPVEEDGSTEPTPVEETLAARGAGQGTVRRPVLPIGQPRSASEASPDGCRAAAVRVEGGPFGMSTRSGRRVRVLIQSHRC